MILINAQENSEKVLEFSTKIEELNTSISTLTTERDNSIAEHNLAKEQISTLTEELDSLRAYKLGLKQNKKKQYLLSMRPSCLMKLSKPIVRNLQITLSSN